MLLFLREKTLKTFLIKLLNILTDINYYWKYQRINYNFYKFKKLRKKLLWKNLMKL